MSGLQSPRPIGQAQYISLPNDNHAYKSLPTNQSHEQGAHDPDILDQPTFSPFPPLRNRPANVPPSNEDREGFLEKARTPVLNSDDPEMQLTWAQDTLAYVEIAAQNETRASENQPGRSQTPHTEHQLRVDAMGVVAFLADQHHPKAEFLKGMWLEFGKFGYRVDKKESFRCYSRAAQRGYARAEYRMGMQYESSSEAEKAIKHYNRGVQAGDSASNYVSNPSWRPSYGVRKNELSSGLTGQRLGMMTLLGQHGQPLSYQRGVQLISYAAETADENAPQGAYVSCCCIRRVMRC